MIVDYQLGNEQAAGEVVAHRLIGSREWVDGPPPPDAPLSTVLRIRRFGDARQDRFDLRSLPYAKERRP